MCTPSRPGGRAAQRDIRSSPILSRAAIQTFAWTLTPDTLAQRGLERNPSSDLAKAIHPKVLYPYHTRETKTAVLVDLLKGEKRIEVRIREMGTTTAKPAAC
jgi:hypothetical protein